MTGKKASFTRYHGDDIEVVAFFHCNGCDCDYDNDKKYLEKISRVIMMKPDAVHIGICTCVNGMECLKIKHIIETLEANSINVIHGTH